MPSTPERFPAVFNRGRLDGFNFKQRLTIRIADLSFYLLIRAIGATLRFETDHADYIDGLRAAGHPYILALWYNRIFAGVYFLRHRDIAALTSKSMDGEYIARFLTRFGFGAVRGSSNRGGVRGLVEMIRLMRGGIPMAFTVDGPRGPRYVAKSGPVMLAKKTGNPIVPFTVECSSYWQVKSWDKLQIPKPFARASVIFSDPIFVADDCDVEIETMRVQNALDVLTANGEDQLKT